jgi:hypothetical protein
MWFAHTDEREGTFVMSNPDFNALRLPLVAMPAVMTPMPSPVATAVGTPAPAVAASPSPKPEM